MLMLVSRVGVGVGWVIPKRHFTPPTLSRASFRFHGRVVSGLSRAAAQKVTPQILPLSKDMDCDEINASGIVNAVISGPGLSAEVEEDSAMSPTLTATADASSSRSGGRGGGSAGAGESGAGAVGKGIAGSAEVAVASCSPLSTSGASEGRGEATDQNDEKEDAGAPDGGGDPLPAAAMVAEERAAATAAANMSVAPTLAGTGVENSPAEIPADGREGKGGTISYAARRMLR